MAKTLTVTQTKTATKEANTKTATKDKTTTKKAAKADAADKPKREPSAYQLFCKENIKKWNDAHPDRKKDAMTEVALLWRDAPENLNRGKEPMPKKPKAPKEPKERKDPKKATKSKPKKKPEPPVPSSSSSALAYSSEPGEEMLGSED